MEAAVSSQCYLDKILGLKYLLASMVRGTVKDPCTLLETTLRDQCHRASVEANICLISISGRNDTTVICALVEQSGIGGLGTIRAALVSVQTLVSKDSVSMSVLIHNSLLVVFVLAMQGRI